MQLLLIGLIQLWLACLALAQDVKRLFVFEHVRHGARGPWQALNADYEDVFGEKWSGMGELTSVGQRMHYLLGVRNRKRFIPFLNSSYDPNEILIYSTKVNRTIASIGAQLQGLYPTSTGAKLTEGQIKNSLPPNPISPKMKEEIQKLGANALPNQMDALPIHIFNPYERTFSLNDNVNCPALVKIKEDNINSIEMKALARKAQEKFNATFGEPLFKYFNIKDPNYYFNTERIYDVADIFISAYTDGREMKKLKETKIDFEALYAQSLEISFMNYYPLEFKSDRNFISILSMSPTYRKVLSWMNRRYKLDQQGKSDETVDSAPKMVIYSGHDTTLATNYYFMEELFGIPIEQCFFASNVYLELIKKGKDAYFVQFYSNDKMMKEIPYEEFKRKVSEALWAPEQIETFCYGKTFDVWMITAFALSALAVVLGVSLGIMIDIRKKRQKSNLTSKINIITEPLTHNEFA